MADAGASARENGFGATLRRDPWWLEILPVVAVLGTLRDLRDAARVRRRVLRVGPVSLALLLAAHRPEASLVAVLAGAPDSRRAVELPPDLLLLPEGLLPRASSSILRPAPSREEGRALPRRDGLFPSSSRTCTATPVPRDRLPRLPLVRRGPRRSPSRAISAWASARSCSSSTSRCSRRTPSPATRCGTSPGEGSTASPASPSGGRGSRRGGAHVLERSATCSSRGSRSSRSASRTSTFARFACGAIRDVTLL